MSTIYGNTAYSAMENSVLRNISIELENINNLSSDIGIEVVQEANIKELAKSAINKVIKIFESIKNFITEKVSSIFAKLKELIKKLEDNRIKDKFKKILDKAKNTKATNEATLITEREQGDLIKAINEELPMDVLELSKYEVQRIEAFLNGEALEYGKQDFFKFKNSEDYESAEEYYKVLEDEGYIHKFKFTNIQFIEWYLKSNPSENTYKFSEADFKKFEKTVDNKIKTLQDSLKELENSTDEVPNKLKSLDDILKFSGGSEEIIKELDILKYMQKVSKFMFSAYLKCMKEFYLALRHVDERMSRIGFRIDEIEQ